MSIPEIRISDEAYEMFCAGGAAEVECDKEQCRALNPVSSVIVRRDHESGHALNAVVESVHPGPGHKTCTVTLVMARIYSSTIA